MKDNSIMEKLFVVQFFYQAIQSKRLFRSIRLSTEAIVQNIIDLFYNKLLIKILIKMKLSYLRQRLLIDQFQDKYIYRCM